MAMGGACRGAAGRPRRPAYPIKVIICLFIDPIERAVPQLTGIPATAAPTTSGTVRHRRGGTVPDPDCARAGLPRSRHRSRGGEPPGQARDSINDYRRSVTATAAAVFRSEPCRTPIARVLDYRDLDIGRVAENPQVRPGIQSTTTGDL